jgi:hypothetical protein
MPELTSRIVVTSNRQWLLNPRSGTFAVSVDGRRVGAVAPVDRLEVPCVPGSHVVRVRQWWLRSLPTKVSVAEGETVSVEVEDPSRRPFLKTWLSMFFTPGRSLRLLAASSEASMGAYPVSERRSGTSQLDRALVQRRMVTSVVFQLLGIALLVLAVGVKEWTLVAPAVVLMAVGLWLGLRLIRSVRRPPQA